MSSDASTILQEIRELHSPLIPPDGMQLMFSKKGQQYCAECTADDPFYSIEWPCPTRLLADEEGR